MVNRPSQPEIITVNSEVLQTQIRDLLPSQNGFGSELQASNVITPIIDLTAAAEGSGLPVDLARALAFGSQTVISSSGNTVSIASSPGFYRIYGYAIAYSSAASQSSIDFDMTDGATTKSIFKIVQPFGAVGTNNEYGTIIDIIVWLAAGESISVTTTSRAAFNGSVRQVADSAATLVNPSGYPL